MSFPWALCTAAVFPGCILFMQSRCPPRYKLKVTHLRKGWKQKLLMMCGVEAVSESAVSPLIILRFLMCIEDKKDDWFLQFEPTKKKSRLTVASVKCKIFYYEVVINVWRDKGCTLALMKRSVIRSTQNSHEHSLFLQLAMAVVYWGFLQ